MKKFRYITALCFVCFCMVGPAPVFAAPRKVVIKLASLVPENTPWGDAFNRMVKEWSEATNGEVELVIYHNGIAGNESDVLRKLKMNQIQAAVLSTLGLSTITPGIITVSCPFLIRDDTELDLVLKDLKPELERRINSKGFYTLAWSKVGWLKFFSKAPVFTPDDMKKQKLGSSETEPALMDAFKAMGYQMIPVNMNQIVMSLTGGMVDAVYQSPVYAGGLQLFGLAKNMADINVAPLMGGIIMNQAAWRSIPEKYKPELIRITKRMEAGLDTSILALEAEIIQTMKQYGLIINQLTPAQEQLWYDDGKRIIPALLGKTLDRETYRRIETILTDHRVEQ
ncbi:C4-dicarboxylate-binding protein DctB [Spirochaetia bacterium]|nr:C4-dicarboxylate-binding protein DctB [Spirochaetia bacterium]